MMMVVISAASGFARARVGIFAVSRTDELA